MQISCCPICGLLWSETIDIKEVIRFLMQSLMGQRACPHVTPKTALHRSFDICDCCGCEYGCDDTSAYRQEWLKRGAPWFNKKERPSNWNLDAQLNNIIYNWDELRLK